MPEDATLEQHGWSDRRFQLTPDLETAVTADGTVLLRQTRFATYLSVDPHQYEILCNFTGDRPLRAVVQNFLHQERRPNLQLFYMLVIDAVEKGILVGPDGKPERPLAEEHPSRWAAGWSPLAAVVAAVGLMILGVIPLVMTQWLPALLPASWILVFVFAGLLYSLASLTQGCVLKGSGRDVYDFRIKWRYVIPVLSLDTRDAFMGGRFCQVGVALQGLAIPFLGALAGLLLDLPSLQLAGPLALILLSSPFGHTPAHHLLYALSSRRHQPMPGATHQFLSRRIFTHGFGKHAHLAEENYLLTYSAYAIIWLGFLLRMVSALLQTQGLSLVHHARHGLGPTEKIAASVSLIALACLAVIPVVYQVWLLVANLWAVLRRRLLPAELSWQRAAHSGGEMPLRERVRFLEKNLLFSQLDDAARRMLAERMTFVCVDPGTRIVRENEPGHAMFLITDGGVDILKEDDLGTPHVVADLKAGDLFGEIALLEDVPRTATVRSRERTSLLVLDREDFESCVVSNLGTSSVKTTIQVSAFLRTTEMFSGWPGTSLIRISEKFEFADFDAGATVIEEGKANDSFYVVYEGSFEVRKDLAPVAQLARGDFFGEISLLGNMPATADIIAREASRCLVLKREHFVDFVSLDVLTGSLIDNVARERLAQGACP